MKKFKLKNLAHNTIIISSRLPGGQIPADRITDFEAEILFKSGSQFVELITEKKKRGTKKSS